MNKAMITGMRGFVGRHVAEALRSHGFEVAGLEGATGQRVDLLNADAVRQCVASTRPTVVFHLAGLLRAPTVEAFYRANVIGTANLLEALEQEKIFPTLVLASSSAVYGRAGEATPVKEAAAVHPITHYGASKAAQEVVALRAFRALGIPVVIARVFNVVGPGQPSTLAAGSFARQIATAERSSERTVRVGDLSGSRDFVDVRDVAQAYVRLAMSGESGGVYNVCSGIGTSLQRCLDELVRIARVPISIEPHIVEGRANEVRTQVGDSHRIRADTGWSSEISVEQSMQDLLNFWRLELANS